MHGCGKDRALVVTQRFEPGRDKGGVIVADFGGDFEVGAQEGAAWLIRAGERSAKGCNSLFTLCCDIFHARLMGRFVTAYRGI
jgi:hypothetical protein